MYEEDQKKVLSMYGELFDDAADDTEMAAFMVSPTRQAVALARTYNAKERKLQVNSTSRADDLYEDDEDYPEFMQIIERLRDEAQNRGLLAQKKESRSVWSDAPAGLEPEIPFTPAVADTREEGSAEESEKPSPENLGQEAYEELTFDFSEDEEKPEEETGLDEAALRPDRREREGEQPERKVVVPLAILYSLIAIPVTVALVCLLLVPTFACLGVSAGCLYVGVNVIIAAIGSFAVFADVMVVLGSGIIILALGLLFLWVFIWFVGGAIAGLINGVIALGGNWCSKEVSAK